MAAHDKVVFAAVGLHHLPLAAVGQVFAVVGLHHLALAAVGQVLDVVDHNLQNSLESVSKAACT